MATGALILAVALLTAPDGDAGRLEVRTAVTVERTGVLFGDIVDVSPLPPALRMRAAALPVAAFKPGQQRMTFPSGRMFERARALMPALAPWLSKEAATRISVELVSPSVTAAARPPRQEPAQCLRVRRTLGAGQSPAAGDLSPAPCGDAAPATAFRYDAAARTLRAGRDLASGEVIAAIPTFALASVAPGQRVSVRSSLGPVRIEREVVALQSAGPGQSLFVQGAGGEVFSVPFADIAP